MAECEEFTRRRITVGDITHDVYEIGQGRPVVVMHELPGLADAAFSFARRLCARGFRVTLPHLFGPLNERAQLANLRHLCVSAEFARLKAGVSAPIVDWLRGLARQISAEREDARVGVIGMCLTGAFAIPLVLEPRVGAAVASQPSIPFSRTHVVTGLGGNGPWARELNVADADIAAAAERLRAEGRTLLAFRFEQDRICVAGKMERLRDEFGDRLDAHEYDYSGGLRRTFNRPHAVLTEEYDRAPNADASHPTRRALEALVAFLDANL